MRAAAATLMPVLAFPAFAREPARTIHGPVTWVADGDTIDVAGTLVRLGGLHAPEPPHPAVPRRAQMIRGCRSSSRR